MGRRRADRRMLRRAAAAACLLLALYSLLAAAASLAGPTSAGDAAVRKASGLARPALPGLVLVMAVVLGVVMVAVTRRARTRLEPPETSRPGLRRVLTPPRSG
jgi:hypothetical protein